MTNETVGGSPTPDELRKLLAQPTTGKFRLMPRPADSDVRLTAPEDEGVLFQDYLDNPRERAMEDNPLTRRADSLPRVKTNKGKVNIIHREIAKGSDIEVARLLGITRKAAERYRTTGSHSGKVGLVRRMRNVYTITEIMVGHFPDDRFIDDRIGTLKTIDSRFGVSPWQLMVQGHTDMALALVERAFRYGQEGNP